MKQKLDIAKAAQILRLSESTLRKRCVRGQFTTAEKIENKWYISRMEVYRNIFFNKKRMIISILLGSLTIIGFIVENSGYDLKDVFELHKQKTKINYIRQDIEPANDNQILILIAKFKNNGTNKYNISERISKILNDNLFMVTGSSVIIRELNESIPRSDMFAPNAIANKYNASILIWGDYDDVGINHNFAFPDLMPYSSNYQINKNGFQFDDKLQFVANEMRILKTSERTSELWNNYLDSGLPKEFREFSIQEDNLHDYLTIKLPGNILYLASMALGIFYTQKDMSLPAKNYLNICIKASERYKCSHSLDVAYFYRGKYYLGDKEFDNALYCFSRAIGINSRNFEAYIYRANVYINQRKFNLAKNDCEFVIKENIRAGFYVTNRDLFNLNYYYYLACLELGIRDKVQEFYTKLVGEKEIKIDNKILSEIHSNFALFKYRDKDYVLAKDLYELSFKLDSSRVEPLFWAGISCIFLGENDNATYLIDKYKSLEPDTSRLKRNMKLVYKK